MDIDLRPIGEGVAPGEKTQPFFDGRLEGDKLSDFRIAMIFQLGDPAYATPATAVHNRNSVHPGVAVFRGVHYFCQNVLLEEVYILNPVKEPGVVTCTVKGSGSAPLERWVGASSSGGGAFGLLDPRAG